MVNTFIMSENSMIESIRLYQYYKLKIAEQIQSEMNKRAQKMSAQLYSKIIESTSSIEMKNELFFCLEQRFFSQK